MNEKMPEFDMLQSEDGNAMIENMRAVKGDKFAFTALAIALGNHLSLQGQRALLLLGEKGGVEGDHIALAKSFRDEVNVLMNLCVISAGLEDEHAELVAQARTLEKIVSPQ